MAIPIVPLGFLGAAAMAPRWLSGSMMLDLEQLEQPLGQLAQMKMPILVQCFVECLGIGLCFFCLLQSLLLLQRPLPLRSCS